jgi:DNA primase
MDEVEEIKRRIDIVDLISSYLTLKKAGANYRALCPFHNEKTPSLMVSPEKQIFKCFGCNEGGDVFSFVMKMENLEFREALEMLAERAGVKLKARRPLSPEEKPDKKSRLFKINALSAQVFHKILTAHPAGKSALEYLKKRKLSNQTIKDFLIGYAPSNKVLAPFLKKRGFTEQEIQNAGGPDRFYKRIIFPIRDIMGNCLGFTGRVLDPKQEPKYLNTPETIIFHKGRILFNLEKARGEIKLEKATVVVEGQMDVIASYQAGVKNVVATSGTALTPEHLRILYRYTPNIIFAFDSDTAGLATAKKAYEQALSEGFNVKMVELGRYKDPGEMIAADPTAWQKAVQNSQPVIDWYFDLAFHGQDAESNKLTSVQKKEIAKEILPVIKKIPDTIEQAHFVGLLAKRLDVNEQVVFDALQREKEAPGRKEIKISKVKQLSSEDLFLGLLIKNPHKIKDYIEKIHRLKGANSDIYKALFSWYNKGAKGNLLDFLKSTLEPKETNRLKLIILEAETQYPPELADQALQDIFKNYQHAQKENLKAHYAREISIAEKQGNRERLKTLIKEFQDAIAK